MPTVEETRTAYQEEIANPPGPAESAHRSRLTCTILLQRVRAIPRFQHASAKFVQNVVCHLSFGIAGQERFLLTPTQLILSLS